MSKQKIRDSSEENICYILWTKVGESSGKEPPARAGGRRDAGFLCGSGRSPGEKYGSPLQCSYLETPVDRGAWQVVVHRVAKSLTRQKQLSTQHGQRLPLLYKE